MIAISILTLAVGGAFTLIQQALVTASVAESKLLATYLGQEGIEIVRNIRDSNWLIQRANRDFPWKEGLSTGIYEADYNDLTLSPYSGEGRDLYIEGSSGFYAYLTSPGPGDVKTKFKRRITLTEIGIDKLNVSVQVRWSERGRSHNVEISEQLYNWDGY